jgi:hypothetical protein
VTGLNLYRCFRCGWTTDVGLDDAAGDEDAVRARIAHQCRNPWSPGARVARALTDVDDELRPDERHDPESLETMADYAAAWSTRWRTAAADLRSSAALEDHPQLFGGPS